MTSSFDLLTLALLPGVGPRALREATGRDPIEALGPAAADRLTSGAAQRRADEEREKARRAGVRLATWDDEDYPELLTRAYDPPPVLWVRGALARTETAVAIVGSRGASAAGRLCARAMG